MCHFFVPIFFKSSSLLTCLINDILSIVTFLSLQISSSLASLISQSSQPDFVSNDSFQFLRLCWFQEYFINFFFLPINNILSDIFLKHFNQRLFELKLSFFFFRPHLECSNDFLLPFSNFTMIKSNVLTL